jgi:hypothetical protein
MEEARIKVAKNILLHQVIVTQRIVMKNLSRQVRNEERKRESESWKREQR